MFQHSKFTSFLFIVFFLSISNSYSMKFFKRHRKNRKTTSLESDEGKTYNEVPIENKETLLDRIKKYLEAQSQKELSNNLKSQIVAENKSIQNKKKNSQITTLNKVLLNVLVNKEQLTDEKLVNTILNFIVNQGASIETFTHYSLNKSQYPRLGTLQELLQ